MDRPRNDRRKQHWEVALNFHSGNNKVKKKLQQIGTMSPGLSAKPAVSSSWHAKMNSTNLS